MMTERVVRVSVLSFVEIQVVGKIGTGVEIASEMERKDRTPRAHIVVEEFGIGIFADIVGIDEQLHRCSAHSCC